MRTIHCTAASLRAVLCYIASGQTPAIAYDRDDMAKPLADKLTEACNSHHGSIGIMLHFSEEETELQRQFEGCVSNIEGIFRQLKGDFRG